MELNTKNMKNTYSLALSFLFLYSLSSFPRGLFLFLSGCHHSSGCLNWPREESVRCFRWGWGCFCLYHSCLANASLLSDAIPSSRSHPTTTHSRTRGGILALTKHTHTHTHGRGRRAQSHWRHWRWLAFLSGGRRKAHRRSLLKLQLVMHAQNTHHTSYSVTVMSPSCSLRSLPGVVYQTGGYRGCLAVRKVCMLFGKYSKINKLHFLMEKKNEKYI